MTQNNNVCDNNYEFNPFQWDKVNGRFYLASEPTLLIRKQQQQRLKNNKETGLRIDHQSMKGFLNGKKKKKEIEKKIIHTKQVSTTHNNKNRDLSSGKWERLLHPWQRNLLLASEAAQAAKGKRNKNNEIRKANRDTILHRNYQRRGHTAGSLRPSNQSIRMMTNDNILKTFVKKKSGKKKRQIKILQSPFQVGKINDVTKMVSNKNKIIPSSHSIPKPISKTASPPFAKLGFDRNELINSDDDSISEIDDDMWSWSQEKEEERDTNISPLHFAPLNDNYNCSQKSKDMVNVQQKSISNDENDDNGSDYDDDDDKWCWEPKKHKNDEDEAADHLDTNLYEIRLNRNQENKNMNHHKENELDSLLPLCEENKHMSPMTNSLDGALTEIHSIHDEEKLKLSFVLDIEKKRQKAILLRRRRGGECNLNIE